MLIVTRHQIDINLEFSLTDYYIILYEFYYTYAVSAYIDG